MKLAILLPSLELGGAERRMTMLAASLKQQGHDVFIWTLRRKGPFIRFIEEAGITIYDLDKGGRYDLLRPAIRVMRLCRRLKPDAIVSCLPSANFYALVPKLAGNQAKVIWGLASASVPVGDYGLWAKLSYRAQAKLARLADQIVVNSYAGRKSAIIEGYPEPKLTVIHTAVDTTRFSLDPDSGAAWRATHGIPQQSLVVGTAGRLDPAKNFEAFLAACEIAAAENQELFFVIAGNGTTTYAGQLLQQIHRHALFGSRLLHIENETDMPAFYNALDIMAVTSKSEGLPNTLVEALACGRYCAVTNVGDCAYAVNEFGLVCETDDARAIASAWLRLSKNRERAPTRARDYVKTTFSRNKMCTNFLEVLSR